MKEKFISILFFLFLIIAPAVLHGQILGDMNMDEEEKPEENVKQIKPKFQLWQLSEYGAFQDSTTLDTMMDFFQVYNPVFKNALTVNICWKLWNTGIE